MSSEALKKAHEKMMELRASGWKPEILNPVEKAKRNPNSLKYAIRAMCWTCEGGDSDPGVKLRVANCTVPSCPLRPHRPWQKMSGKNQTNANESTEEAEVEDDDDDVNAVDA